MIRALTCIGALALVSGAAFGQSAETAPRFEIADVHASLHVPLLDSRRVFMRSGFFGGVRYEIHNATMIDLVRTAYGVDADKVLGGPNWLEMDRYEIVAKAPPDTTQDTLKLMLQTLLADRFKLVAHADKKELPTYALRAGKKPLLKEADGLGETGCKPQAAGSAGRGGMIGINGNAISIGPDGTVAYSCHNMTMAAFTEALHTMPIAGLGNNPLVDETELKGAWNFDFKYSLFIGLPGAQSTRITIIEAVDKQLGLKLEPTKAPLPVIVIDSVNEKPTDNAPGVTKALPDTPTEFDVSDVKPSDPNSSPGIVVGGRGGGGGIIVTGRCAAQPGGRVECRNNTLKNMVALAWGTTPDKIVGGPKFMDTDRFDVTGKAPASALSGNQIDDESLHLMMRALLTDRFKLSAHIEDQPADTYVLVAVKPKLKTADPAKRTSCNDGPGSDGKDPRIANPSLNRLTTCLNITMAEFAEQLPSFAPGYFGTIRSVVDGTGLQGAFDITLSYSGNGFQNAPSRGRGGDAGPAADGGAPDAADPGQGLSLPDALEKQLGLKLETQKRPTPVLVIEHVEQKPTDN
jgi:uncharacterized protein (TIGR03435 family)